MLSFSNISKLQNGEPLYTGANFQINPGEKVGLVGPNGAGKTTLFRLIIKEDKPDTGQISFPKDMRLSYFSQNVGEMAGKKGKDKQTPYFEFLPLIKPYYTGKLSRS